jgi:hypothetical protein
MVFAIFAACGGGFSGIGVVQVTQAKKITLQVATDAKIRNLNRMTDSFQLFMGSQFHGLK